MNKRTMMQRLSGLPEVVTIDVDGEAISLSLTPAVRQALRRVLNAAEPDVKPEVSFDFTLIGKDDSSAVVHNALLYDKGLKKDVDEASDLDFPADAELRATLAPELSIEFRGMNIREVRITTRSLNKVAIYYGWRKHRGFTTYIKSFGEYDIMVGLGFFNIIEAGEAFGHQEDVLDFMDTAKPVVPQFIIDEAVLLYRLIGGYNI